MATPKIHSSTSPGTLNLLDRYPDFQVRLRLKEACSERNLTMKDLAYLTGIRYPTLSNLSNGIFSTINAGQLVAIAAALRITNPSDLIEFRMEKETRDLFESQPMRHVDRAGERDMIINMEYMNTDKKGLSAEQLEDLYTKIAANYDAQNQV